MVVIKKVWVKIIIRYLFCLFFVLIFWCEILLEIVVGFVCIRKVFGILIFFVFCFNKGRCGVFWVLIVCVEENRLCYMWVVYLFVKFLL